MTNRKLKKNVKSVIFMASISLIAILLMVITKDLKTSNDEEQTYVMNTVVDNITPVVSTNTDSIIKPFTNSNVSINKTYYDKDASQEEQEKSLINYEDTYLKNSGIIYSSNEDFDVVSVLNGTVIDIKEDELLNTVVYVSHDNNITTIYYGLKDVNVKVNDQVTQNQIIGKSNMNKFCSEGYSLLFEVNNNGKVINPEQFYTMNLNELN